MYTLYVEYIYIYTLINTYLLCVCVCGIYTYACVMYLSNIIAGCKKLHNEHGVLEPSYKWPSENQLVLDGWSELSESTEQSSASFCADTTWSAWLTSQSSSPAISFWLMVSTILLTEFGHVIIASSGHAAISTMTIQI